MALSQFLNQRLALIQTIPLYYSTTLTPRHRNMGSKPKISASAAAVRRLRRRSPTRSRKTPHGGHRRSARHIGGGAAVSEKLEALRDLVPTQNLEINTDRLFEDTADYIIRLKTQVFVLQSLIKLYGFEPQENRDGV